jgi:hypothetical protein
MTKTIAAVAVAAGLALSCPLAGAQCLTNADCKSDRICERGACVAPSNPAVAPAAAAPAYAPAAGAGRVRLDLNLGLLGFTYMKIDKDSDEGMRSFAFNGGPAPVSRFGFGIGYELSNRISIGARVILGFSAVRPKDADDEDDDDKETDFVFDYAVLPYLEYALGTDRIRPYLTVVAGLDGTMYRSKYEGSEGDVDYTERDTVALSFGVIGVGGGAHVFLADSVSLDLWLLEMVGVGALDYKSSIDIDGDTESEEDKTFAWRSRTELFVGITGWI